MCLCPLDTQGHPWKYYDVLATDAGLIGGFKRKEVGSEGGGGENFHNHSGVEIVHRQNPQKPGENVR